MPEHIEESMQYRLKILAVLIQSDWLMKYGAILKPEHMPSKPEQEIVKWINEYYAEYRSVPTEDALRHGLKRNRLVEDVLSIADSDLVYVADSTLDFVKTQALKLAILQSVNDIEGGDLQRPRDRIEEALKIGVDRSDLGSELIANSSDWVYDELHGKRFPTGWSELDKRLGGGVVAGEYWLVMAPPGGGKTTMLINIGYAMTGLLGAANVLHISLEMPKTKILKRYGARITGVRLARGESLDMSEAVFRTTLAQHASKKLRAKLRVIDRGFTLNEIREILQDTKEDGFVTQALIVDYPDLMTAPRKRNELRFELADISRGLKNIGHEFGIPVWGATQAGRQSFGKEVITMADIAEALEKASIADGIIALCRTADEKKLGHGRLYVAKARDMGDSFSIPVKIDYKNQSIVQRMQ